MGSPCPGDVTPRRPTSAAWPAHQLRPPPTSPRRFGKPTGKASLAAAGGSDAAAADAEIAAEVVHPVCSLPSALPAVAAPSCPEGTTSGTDADGNFQ